MNYMLVIKAWIAIKTIQIGGFKDTPIIKLIYFIENV